MRVSYLCCTASILALCLTSAVQAQDMTGQGQTTTVDEIIVTAERRSETLQRSSLAMSVIAAAEAQALTKPSDLTAVAPGVQVGGYGPQPQIYIRGVGDQTGNSRGQSAVAFNIDGVFYGRGSAVGPSMFDIARIEILKGPQGTLYGRNASGGAINIITAAPELGELFGYANGEAGSENLRRGNAAVNLPLGETAALRIAGQVVKRDGYLSDGSQDEDSRALRARLLWKPGERTSFLLNADVSHVGGIGGGYAVYPATDGNPWRGARAQPLPWSYQFNAATAPPNGAERCLYG